MLNATARSSFEARIHEIIARASAAVLEAVHAEKSVGISQSSSGARRAASKSKPTVKKAAATEKPAPTKPTATQPATPAAREPHPNRSYTDADIERVLELIAGKPGLRTEEIKKAADGIAPRAVEKILDKLRAGGRVKTTGIKRTMTYAVAGGGKPAKKGGGGGAKSAKSKPAKKVDKKRLDMAAAPAPGAAPEPVAATPAPVATPEPAAPTPATAASAAKAKSRRKGGDQSDAILAVIRENPGLRAEQIRARVGLPAAWVTAVLEKLRGAKQVATSGKARGTTYAAL